MTDMDKRSGRLIIITAVSMVLNVISFFLLIAVATVIGIYHGTMPIYVNASVMTAFIILIWPVISLLLSVLSLIFSVKAKISGQSSSYKKILAAALELVIVLSVFILVAVTYFTNTAQL